MDQSVENANALTRELSVYGKPEINLSIPEGVCVVLILLTAKCL